MVSVLEYIMQNYTWFLSVTILILLAIIGNYAEKTNFGQGKKKEEELKEANAELKKQGLGDYIDTVSAKKVNISKEDKTSDIEDPNDLKKTETVLAANQVTKSESLEEQMAISTVSSSLDEDFNQEFNNIIPKKELINEDLINDIDNLSLDKTQKFNFRDIPDLDDVELPKIKSLSQEDEDIWKF